MEHTRLAVEQDSRVIVHKEESHLGNTKINESVLYNQMGTTSKAAISRMMKDDKLDTFGTTYECLKTIISDSSTLIHYH